MHDPIAPPLARHPAEAAELVCQAISDGDLEAAVAQYEHGAVLRLWAADANTPEDDGTGDRSQDTVAAELAALMDFRLPLVLRVRTVVRGPGVALVLAERQMRGSGPDGQPVQLSGSGAAVLRRGRDGGWRIAADAWCLTCQRDPG